MAEITIIIRDVGKEVEFFVDADEEIPETGDPTAAQELALAMLQTAMDRVTPVGPKPVE